MRQELRLNADAEILNDNADAIRRLSRPARAPDLQRNSGAFRAELAGIEQQIREYLFEARRVAFDVDGLGTQRHRKRLAAPLKLKVRRLDRILENGRQFQRRLAQLQAVSSDAPDIDQIVHHACHEVDL